MKVGQVVNTILKIANKEGLVISNMNIQKILYFAHGSHFSFFDKPLIDNPIRIGRFGPLYKKVFKFYRISGTSPIDNYMGNSKGEIYSTISEETEDYKHLKSIVEYYAVLSNLKLTEMILVPRSPYILAKENDESFISNLSIKTYFQSLGSKFKPKLKLVR